MKKAIDVLTLLAICAWFGAMGYSVYVDHAHKAAVDEVVRTTEELRIKAELDGENK